MEVFLIHIGVNPTDLFAGFTGGMLAGLITSGSRPNAWSILCAIVIGAGAASYLGPVAPPYVGIKPSGSASFVIGLAGTPICKRVILAIGRLKWSPVSQKVQDDNGDNHV